MQACQESSLLTRRRIVYIEPHCAQLVVCLTQKVSYREPHERGELFRGEGRLAWSR
jgi:hypothetical protein